MGKRIELPFTYERKAVSSKPVAVPKPVKKTAAKKKAKTKTKKAGRPSTGFNRNEYQRLWMADKAPAKAAGMTVAEWRAAGKPRVAK